MSAYFHIAFSRTIMLFMLTVMASLTAYADTITVVSDTTGYCEWTEEGSTGSICRPDAGFADEGDTDSLIAWAMRSAAVPLLVLGLILVSPLLLILAVAFLLLRQRRKQDPATLNPIHCEPMAADRRKRDRHIMHLAVSGGVTVWSVVYGWKLLALGSIIYACMEGVRLYQCLRDDNP